jgi:DNA-binding GntR family transcriptional regulator
MDRLPKKTNGKQPLGIKAYEKIHEKIITLEYKPGQSLEEKQLMRHLGLGRTPIREALMRLVGERVLESQPGKGFMVRQITLQNTRAVFEMMKILETGAAELAICQDTDAFIPEMERAAQEVKAAVDTMNILRLVQANHDFHLNFARCARNEYLIRWINETRNEAKRLSYLSYTSEIDPAKSLKTHYDAVIGEHEAIIRYLRARDESHLKATILAHIQAFQKRIIIYMSA